MIKCAISEMNDKFVFFLFSARIAPFNIRFVSDNYEFEAESKNNPDGFELAYILRPCSQEA